MTTTPETPANATDLAERALIGALLADPSRVRDVRDWLRPGDVHEPKTRSIYRDVGERARRLSGTTTVSRIKDVLHFPPERQQPPCAPPLPSPQETSQPDQRRGR